MGVPTVRYVSEGDAGGTPDGTTWAKRWGDLQSALDAETTAGTGFRFKVYTSSAVVQTAVYNLTTMYTPTVAAPCIIEGTNSDGTAPAVATYDGDALYGFVVESAANFVMLRNLHITNNGAIAYPVDLYTSCYVENCEVDNGTGTAAIRVNNYSQVINSYIHNFGGYGVNIKGFGGKVLRCRFEDATNTFTYAIEATSNAQDIRENIIWLNTAAGVGIRYRDNVVATNNSIYNNFSTGGTAHGIQVNGVSEPGGVIDNNIIEGFNGTNGSAIELAASSYTLSCRGNSFFENTDNVLNDTSCLLLDNETLTVSAFTDAANKDFRPVDTDSVKEGSLPGGVGLY